PSVSDVTFAGIFATHRNGTQFTANFDQFSVSEEQPSLALTFDANELIFNAVRNQLVPEQSVNLIASSGTPEVIFSDDPDATEWLIFPTNTAPGTTTFGVQTDLPPGTYTTTVFAIDQPDLGYANAEITITLNITEPADFEAKINFSDAATAVPVGFLKDSGAPYGDQGNGFNYGWFQTNGTVGLDLSANTRNRNINGVDLLVNTLIHMQYADTGGSNGTPTEGIWELEVPNGTYLVVIGAGDPSVDGAGTEPTHRINAEGINIIDDFQPSGSAGSSTRWTMGSAVVSVSDGRLTLDATGGFNTKINYVEVTSASGVPQTPEVVGVFPADNAIGISVNTSISANNLFLPNFDENGIAGVNNATITNSTVKLFKEGSTTPLGATVNGTGGGDAINLVPSLPLEANTTYVFEIDGVQDTSGETFAFFTSSFTTGSGGGGGDTNLDDVSFANAGPVGSSGKYSTLTVGPDNKLYGLQITGDIHRWTMETDGTLSEEEILVGWKASYESRAAIGLVFDPTATAENLVAYISHQSGALSNAPDWDGKISRISGAQLENEELLVTDLPRSLRDHLTNSLAFRPGENNALYFNQGSLSAAGEPDNAWGNRPESMLSAATLRLDLSLLPATLPLNVRTTRNIEAIKAVDVNSPTLDGLYNPYFVNAPLTLYASGVRNAYDLAWHSNGQLYIPTNGTAGGSNAPASIDDMPRPNGTVYDHDDPSGNYPVVPLSSNNNTQKDWLFRVNPSEGIGYFGHPNPYRGEFVLNRGDVDVTNSAYNGVQPDINYRGAAFDFEFNKSPNGVIEYRSNAENGNLQGALLVVRYSGSSDIIALVPDGPNGDIGTFKEGIPGFTGFQDPLDLIEDVNTGNIYVSDYGRSQIVLLRPSNQSSPLPVIALGQDKFIGDAVATGSATSSSEIVISNLGNAPLNNIEAVITGDPNAEFSFSGLPTSIDPQNSSSFTVIFDPSSVGPKEATLTLSGTDADPVVITLRGLGKSGTSGSSEPSLQWILDTHLGAGAVATGDTDPTTNIFEPGAGLTFNDLLGDEVDAQSFERAVDAPITLEVLGVYGPQSETPIVDFGWYPTGNPGNGTELFTVENTPSGNGQTLTPSVSGLQEFDPGTQPFGFFNRWPFFGDRILYSEDALNTFTDAIPHHVRVYPLPGESDAYIIVTEEHISGFDYQDIVVVARNIRPAGTTLAGCNPISTLDCNEIETGLPFNLDFNGDEGGLANTGFTMVDNPSARLSEDGPISNPNVPGFEPGQLSFADGNLVIVANKGISFVNNTDSDMVNSQINALGVGINAAAAGDFSIRTSIVAPYTDADNNSEQAGIWFGLNEDNYVKLVANAGGQIELRSETGGVSTSQNQVQFPVEGLNTSTVGLRLLVDQTNGLLVAYYTLNLGTEVELGSLPLPTVYTGGNPAYGDLSFAGIFATKRREDAATPVSYTFENFSILSGSSQPFFANVSPADNATNLPFENFQITVDVVVPAGYELDKNTLAGNVNLYELVNGEEVLVPSNSNDTGGGDAITLTPTNSLKTLTSYRFRLSAAVEANRIGDLNDRLPFIPFESEFTTGDEDSQVPPLDLTGVTFTKVLGGTSLGEGTTNQRFSSLAIGPDGKLYASTIGDFASDGKIYRWDIALDGTLNNLEILSPELQGSPDPNNVSRNNENRLIIGFAFDPQATADNLIAYVTHSAAVLTDGPVWDGKLTRLSGPDLAVVEDLIIHLPRSAKDHLTNSITFDEQGNMYINQGSNSAGGEPDGSWAFRPERLLSAAVLKLELDKMPSSLPLSAFTTDNIEVINAAPSGSIQMSDGSYNPYATNSPLTIFASGVRNAYDLVWHSNGWLYVPTNGTAGGSNTPGTADYLLARRIDGLTALDPVPGTTNNETQKDWLFKTKGGSYHGHPNPYRGEFILNHGGAPYSGLPGQQEVSYVDVAKYPSTLGPDPNYLQPAYDFEKNKSPNGVIEYKSDSFDGKLRGLLMVVRFSGQDDLLVMQPSGNGDIADTNGNVPGLGGFDDPLDVVEDPRTGNIYISEYDRDGNGTPRITLLRADVPATPGPEIAANPVEGIFEITTNSDGANTDTQIIEITNEGNANLNISGASITGPFASQFDAVVPSGAIVLAPGEIQEYSITYAPDLTNSDLGYQEATLTVLSDDEDTPSLEVGLHALKKAGFEGGNEPPLQDVVDALGIGINVGWTSLGSSTSPTPVGDELEVERWIKATDGPITLTPVGRYSPSELLPFGWYTNDQEIVLNEVGILSDGIANAQTLFPPVNDPGVTSFDPLGAVFGIYVESNIFNRVNYTEDALNTGIAHRTRIYPNRDREGNPIENSYLIAFEDAENGDYQDYVFVLDNAAPFEDDSLILTANPNTLDFTVALNQELIQEKTFTLTGTGGITAGEITLEASENWIVIPEVTLGTPIGVTVDTEGLQVGSYQGVIAATAPNYQAAEVTINLLVTNELVFTYQFNFQSPADVEISPDGYIDDLGAPFGPQVTSLGTVNFGWVEPGTTNPADASANARNRNNGTGDDPLLKTFTIIGHRSTNLYPQRDWLIEVPNGSYFVNISVGDPDFTDSYHQLDVNGVTVLDYNQENATDGLVNFDNTSLVEVTDGVLRLSLGTDGVNAKPNFIRLAPVDNSLLPPNIIATFEGNQSIENTYRGPVQVTLEAIDQSESGGIARLEYILDENPTVTYSEPFDVTAEGPHVLLVNAEDNNGNISERTFEFSIEPATGAVLAIENLTKVPGTSIAVPAEDYFTFHNVGATRTNAIVNTSNTMRVRNTGTGILTISELLLPSAANFSFSFRDFGGNTVANLPTSVQPGEYLDVDIEFIRQSGAKGLYIEELTVVSNADNALDGKVTLSGGYMQQFEGDNELNAQQVIDAFGYKTSMLSIVNDEGTITPPNPVPTRPSSNYPIPENIDLGYEGDMVLSDNFVQADPSKPVIGFQLAAFHGFNADNMRLLEPESTAIFGGVNISHDENYYQTLLPNSNTDDNLNYFSAESLDGPFRINIVFYPTSGGNNRGESRPDLLGLRMYKVIDRDGNVIPNEYIAIQDNIGSGCGAGSANCDWNDMMFYFVNIRPEGTPTALPVENITATPDVFFDFDIRPFFDKGYPGNALTISAATDNGSLPSWLSFDPDTGMLEGTPPTDTSESLTIEFIATDLNGLTATTSLIIIVGAGDNLPPVAVASASPLNGDVPLNVRFTGSNSTDDSGIAQYSWDFGDGNTSTDANPSHTYITPGTYTATLTVTDGDGLQDDASVQIIVNDPDSGAIAGFTLIDASSDVDLFELTNGLQIDPSVVADIDLSIRTNTNPPVIGSVRMVLSGPVSRTQLEGRAPYSLFGDLPGIDYSGVPFPQGTYTLTATAYDGSYGAGNI
ncbi:PKD domain-containing protein, partial [Robiginitalea aurantiaca]